MLSCKSEFLSLPSSDIDFRYFDSEDGRMAEVSRETQGHVRPTLVVPFKERRCRLSPFLAFVSLLSFFSPVCRYQCYSNKNQVQRVATAWFPFDRMRRAEHLLCHYIRPRLSALRSPCIYLALTPHASSPQRQRRKDTSGQPQRKKGQIYLAGTVLQSVSQPIEPCQSNCTDTPSLPMTGKDLALA